MWKDYNYDILKENDKSEFVFLGETDFGSIFTECMFFQLMMNIEIAAICFVISAVSKKNRLGIGISVADAAVCV